MEYGRSLKKENSTQWRALIRKGGVAYWKESAKSNHRGNSAVVANSGPANPFFILVLAAENYANIPPRVGPRENPTVI